MVGLKLYDFQRRNRFFDERFDIELALLFLDKGQLRFDRRKFRQKYRTAILERKHGSIVGADFFRKRNDLVFVESYERTENGQFYDGV